MWERGVKKCDITVVQTVTEEGWNEFKIISKVSWPGGHKEVERLSNKVELIPNVEIMLEYCIELAEDAWSDTADKKLREIGFKICRDVDTIKD